MFKEQIPGGLLFMKKFLANPGANGSLLPSSSVASRSMFRDLDFDRVDTIVELGPGLGVFTREYLKHVRPDTRVILFEVEPAYRRRLERQYGDRLVLAEDARAMSEVLRELNVDRADLIVSSLPLTLGDTLQAILTQVKSHTDRGAVFRFYTYLPFAMKKHYRELPVKRSRFVLRNFPPMWIYGVN